MNDKSGFSVFISEDNFKELGYGPLEFKEVDKKKNKKQIDFLTEDEPIYGQKFVCLSFTENKNTNGKAIKVRGVFGTYEEAIHRCKQLQQVDKDFDIFIGEVGKWLPFNPMPEACL